MEISERLKTVASFVRNGGTVADIGTDHGYVPIYLYKEGRIDRAIACDINREPVRRAQININMYHLSDVIETRLGSGLKPLVVGEADGAIIAGMGGMLIIDILEGDRGKTLALKELILQPQTDIDKVRRYIHSVGFRIDDEKMLLEEGIYYTVIRAVPGRESYDNDADYLFGKINIDKKSQVLKDFLNNTMRKNADVMERLRAAGTENSKARLAELERYDGICGEVFQCL